MPELAPPAVPAGSMRSREQPTLEAGGLHLRPWLPADAAVVVEAYRDEAIRRWHVRSMTAEEAGAWVLSWAERWQAESGAGWAITEAGTVVGRMSFRAIDLAEGVAEAAFWVMPDARGRGVASRALVAATEWMLGDLGLQRLELQHSTANAASCAVAERAGYRAEGTRRRAGLHADGWHDMHLHARLREDAAVS